MKTSLNQSIMLRKLANTKDVLGDHLHQKIKEVEVYIGDHLEETGWISKITGILLEKSVEDIYRMLSDQNVLKINIKIATESLEENRTLGCAKQGNAGLVRAGLEKSAITSGNSDEVGEQLYNKVFLLDSLLAPQITGMLLELGEETVIDLLNNPALFQRAFERAKSCLQPSGNSSAETEERLSNLIYKRAGSMYKKYAPQITGMILELDSGSLVRLVQDKNTLDEAIQKAYNVLLDNELS